MSGSEKVAIIGGGCASIAAAFELSRPEHGGKYEITVYQQGWRLGGKGASGRGAADRIEEHGLHIWMGFYDNAFLLMRECYEELGRDPETHRIATWRDAFFEGSQVGVTEKMPDGGWNPWTAVFPPTKGLPGDPLEGNPFSVTHYMVRSVQLVATLLKAAAQPTVDAGPPEHVPEQAPMDPPRGDPRGVLELLQRLVGYGQLATLAGLLEALQAVETALLWWQRRPLDADPQRSLLAELVGSLSKGISRFAEKRFSDVPERKRLWEIIDLMLTIVRGSIRDGLLTNPDGFDAIDDFDFREWLERHGASQTTLDSAFIRAVAYDLLFAYEDGDTERPRTSAAQALRGGMRMFFGYRGALFWRMQAGMGDIVFAPFYEVLRKRGVRFEFFHRLEAVRMAGADDDGGPHVEALEFDVQAKVRSGDYEPLVDVRDLPCWPSEPDWSQLVNGHRLRAAGTDFESFWDRTKRKTKTLRVIKDFDYVVLGVGLGAVPHVCSDLVERDARWRRMVDEVKTVETQAFQLWMEPDMSELGWHGPEEVTLSGFVEPFDTWAAMPHLLPEESWPEARKPRSLAYFCNVLPTPEASPDRDDEAYPARRLAEVRANAVEFLDREVAMLWPEAAGPDGGFDWPVLVEAATEGEEPPAGIGGGHSRFDTQFWTANVNPTDRYVLSLPGTAKCRISPLDNTYDNLTVAGDWTACGHVAGCVEAAVMSGRLAAHAIAKEPALEDIVGFDHP